MTISSPELEASTLADPDLARFALWPLPELDLLRVSRSDRMLAPAEPTPEDLAYARGLEDGRTEAVEEAGGSLKRAAGLLASAAGALEGAQAGFLSELEDNLHLLALAIARHLIQREVALDPGIVREMVQRGLVALPVGSRVEVHLNPEDLDALSGQLQLPGDGGRGAEIQWIADPAIERGGCTLETPHRVVDGRVDQALRDLYQRLRDA